MWQGLSKRNLSSRLDWMVVRCFRVLPAFRLILLLLACRAIGAAAETAAGRGVAGPPPAYENSWPQWRGPLANGFTPRANPPIHWSETNNIRWKISLSGKGHSSPIVFGD